MKTHEQHKQPKRRTVVKISRVLLSDAYQATLNVKGMRCPACAQRVNGVLTLVDGVHAVDVSLSNALVSVIYEPRRVCIHCIGDGIARAGRGSGHRFRSSLIHVGPYTVTREHHHNNTESREHDV